MRKLIAVLIVMVVFAACCAIVWADMGIPEKPKYTVVTALDGTTYYTDYTSDGMGSAAGTLSGGQTFYVWNEFDNSVLWGTTDPNASGDQYDSFVYVRQEDTMDSSSTISPDTGTSTGSKKYAKTTGELNVRCGPGTGFDRITTLNKGTHLEYDHTYDGNGQWAYVNADGVNGWVSQDYLKEEERVAEKPDHNENSVLEEETDTKADAEKADADANKSKHILIVIVLLCLAAALIAALVAFLVIRSRRRRRYNRW